MATSRLSALCEQTVLTGVDFIQVVDPLVQTVLRVFFVVEPSALDVPLVDGAQLTPPAPNASEGPLLAENALGVTITSTETGARVPIATLGWRIVRAPTGLRETLEIEVEAPGDFAIHRLNIASAVVDPFFNDRTFSFKQGCPSLFDCRDDCAPEALPAIDYPVDYLARDFESFRRALLDFAAARYPRWSERIEADQAMMLMEIMAALGDEFAYTQDRIARELTLETATQRRSRSALARLVDYQPDPGNAATTELAVFVRAGVGGDFAAIGARIWAMPEGRRPIPLSVRNRVWHHEAWNRIPLHQPDGNIACLRKGATDAFLATQAPTVAQLPPGEPLTPDQFWIGRRAILRSQPADPSEPARAHAVTITAVSHLIDQLVLTNGAPTHLTRISWREPTPWPLPFGETHALLNIAPVVAGEEIVEHFRIGADDTLLARNPALTPVERDAMLALPRAIEREGVFDPARGVHGRCLRYGLIASETRGLGWEGARDPLGIGTASAQRPMLTLREAAASNLAPIVAREWRYVRDILGVDLDSEAFTLEEGVWRKVVTHQTPFADFAFADYASNDGWSLRFGDGDFGRPPEDGVIFELRYFTAEGAAANLAADSVIHLDPPPGAAPGALFGYASAATNPIPISSGRDEETPEDIRINAPEAWRALPLRAVRPEDYSAIIERLDWVQRANAVTAWTGSWSTDFVTADPLGGVGYSGEERTELEHVTDCVRLATRDARVVDPEYLDVDLAVEICVAAYPGEVTPRVIAALANPGFFNPDNFTFGTPLRRSAVEAAVQAVPGVKGVDVILVRVRRRREWRVFDDPEISVGPRQIIRLQNDPLFPARGSLSVSGHGGAA
jgi:hypothetical protein